MARLAGPGRAVVGSSAKTPLLLGAVSPCAYVQIDTSGDFMRPILLPEAIGIAPRLGFFPGSTIGNLTAPTAVDLLRAMADALGIGSMLLIGMDRVKDERELIAAYDDAQGVTAAFNLNLLHRIDRELDGDIPVDAFRHVARWNDGESRVEMHLEAIRDIAFAIGSHRFRMRASETIHTENSDKYGSRGARLLLAAGGGRLDHLAEWTDPRQRFALLLAEVKPLCTAP